MYSFTIFHLSAQNKSNRSDVSLKTLECVRAHVRARACVSVCVCVCVPAWIKMIPNQSWICKYPCCKWNEIYQHTIAQNLRESQDVDISSPQNIQMNDVWQHQGTWNKKKSNTISKIAPGSIRLPRLLLHDDFKINKKAAKYGCANGERNGWSGK